VEDFQHAYQLSLGDQGEAIISDEPFSLEVGRRLEAVLSLVQIGDEDRASLQGNLPGVFLS